MKTKKPKKTKPKKIRKEEEKARKEEEKKAEKLRKEEEKARKEEEKLRKRLDKAEKQALKLTGGDSGLVHRFWEIVSMFPQVKDPELVRRIEHFIMNATPGQYFQMQQVIFDEATPYIVEDPRVKRLMDDLEGNKIGLSVKGEYESTVTICDGYFKVERGIEDNIPVISVESRRDYADAVLNRKDPVKMILQRRIKATHKIRLLRWILPHLDLIRERGIVEKYLSYQQDVEKVLDENFRKLGY